MSYPKCNYKIIREGGKEDKVSHVCFSDLRSERGSYLVDFLAEITLLGSGGRNVSNEAIALFLGFTRRLFKQPFMPKILIRRNGEKVRFRIESDCLEYAQILFYLTWFRYIQEFPDFIYELHKRKVDGDGDEELFRKFQQIHYDYREGKLILRWDNMYGHGLICTYNGSRGTPITISELYDNIKSRPRSVQANFK